MDVLARGDVCRGDADELAVLDNLLATLDVGAGDLVEQRDVLAGHDMALAATRERVGDVHAGLELVNGNDDVVQLVDDDAVSHGQSSLGMGRAALHPSQTRGQRGTRWGCLGLVCSDMRTSFPNCICTLKPTAAVWFRDPAGIRGR